MSAAVVFGSIVLAGLFTALWWLRPAWRRAVEAPKYGFAARVRQHDRACRERTRTHE